MAEFPPGVYYIGDPCYVIPDEEWDEYIEVSDAESNETAFFHGEPTWSHYTAHGDGEYHNSSRSMALPVDSGTIGVVPQALWAKNLTDDEIEGLGHIYTAKSGFKAHYNNGVFTIGRFKINTDF